MNSYGNLLAVALTDAFRAEDGALNLTPFKACVNENGVEAPKVDMERHGAIGRFRICARLMLGRVAKKNGFAVIGGKKIQGRAKKRR